MSTQNLNVKQKELKAQNRSLFMKIKKDFQEKGKPLSKTELNKIIKKKGLKGVETPENIYIISNLEGFSKIKLKEDNTKTNIKKNKITSNTSLYNKYKKIVSSFEANLKKSKDAYLTQDEVFNLLKKLKVTLEEDETDDFIQLLASRNLINFEENVGLNEIKDDLLNDDDDSIEIFDEDEKNLHRLRSMTDSELDNNLGEHIESRTREKQVHSAVITWYVMHNCNKGMNKYISLGSRIDSL